MDRKQFLATSLTAISASAIAASPVAHLLKGSTRIKAIAFDAFPIFDLKPVNTLVEALFPGKGKEISNTWRTTQFEYSWLRTSAGRYKDFLDITKDALRFAAKKTGVALDSKIEEQLITQYLQPELWPDTLPALTQLKDSGVRLCFLSNMSPTMLNACAKHNKIENHFEALISTNIIHSYKPDPEAYRLAMKMLHLKKEEILFTAAAGWDACGAKWFGYPTFWMNRIGAPAEELQVTADGVGKNMDELVKFTVI